MGAVTVTVREIEGRGFWVEIAEKQFFFFKEIRYLTSDGALEDELFFQPSDILRDGLFPTREDANKNAQKFARLARRSVLYGKVTVVEDVR